MQTFQHSVRDEKNSNKEDANPSLNSYKAVKNLQSEHSQYYFYREEANLLVSD